MNIYQRAREYGYINARLRAARPHLLTHRVMENLCDVQSVDAMVEILMGTAYGPYLDELRLKHKGVMLISHAVMKRFSEKTGMIERMMKDDNKRKMLYVVIGRFDVYNLKNLFLEVMKGRKFGSYVNAGDVRRKLDALREIKDVELLCRIVSNMGYAISKESKTYDRIVEDVERSYYERICALKKLCDAHDEWEVKKYIESIIDYKNFDIAIRKEKEVKFIDGGSIHASQIINAISKGREALIKLFGLQKLYSESNEDLSWMEELYDRMMLKDIIRKGNVNPFSLAGVIGFIKLLDIERRNIRSIAVAKNVLSAEQIKRKIIW